MLRIASALVSTAVVATGIVAVTAGTASAACPPPSPGKSYRITNKSTVSKSTNLHSDWVYDNLGGNLTYNHSKTATTSASGTWGVEAEAGVIFAKASKSFSVTVGKSWSKSSSWSYSIPARNKAGKTKVRMTMFHESKKFLATKYTYSFDARCRYHEKKVWAKWFTAPVKKDSNVWGLEWK
ncbi:hypothetical protein ACFYW8_23080 [Streptomyces sp. NPDC002742]|uniref:hypothetical protein n=1 Tax=Streptomyces sp. NPDC002742 TaxID=3364663 RepID=UPI0036C306A4